MSHQPGTPAPPPPPPPAGSPTPFSPRRPASPFHQAASVAVAVAGVVLIAVMFLPWYGPPDFGFAPQPGGLQFDFEDLAEQAGFDTTLNAWQAFSGVDLLLLAVGLGAIALGCVLALIHSGEGDETAARALGLVAVALGAVALAAVLLRLISPPDDLTREVGPYLALVPPLAIIAGGLIAAGVAGPRRAAGSA